VVIAEEVFETDIALPNVAHMQTRPARADRREVDLRRLVAGFLRMAPDVAIVGEVRDREPLRRKPRLRSPRTCWSRPPTTLCHWRPALQRTDDRPFRPLCRWPTARHSREDLDRCPTTPSVSWRATSPGRATPWCRRAMSRTDLPSASG
jgi:hypothetical protein